MFQDLNEAGSSFNKPVESIVLKFTILDKYGDKDIPGNLPIIDARNPYGKGKMTDSLIGFAQEAAIQQQIYLSTVSQRGQPICPAVINFSIFSQQSALQFLAMLLQRSQGIDENAVIMTDYLIKKITNDRTYILGMIGMQVGGSDFTDLGNLAGPNFNEACLHAIDQIIRLTLQSKIANYDCHAGNVLAKRNGSKTYLIDFGRIIQLEKGLYPFNPTYERYIKQIYKSIAGESYDDALYKILIIINRGTTSIYPDPSIFTEGGSISNNAKYRDILNTWNDIVKFVAILDYSISKVLYGLSRPQTISILQSLYGPIFSDNWTQTLPDFTINEVVAQKFKKIMGFFENETTATLGRSATSGQNICALINKGVFFSDQPIRNPQIYNRDDMSIWNDLAPAAVPPAAILVPVAVPPAAVPPAALPPAAVPPAAASPPSTPSPGVVAVQAVVARQPSACEQLGTCIRSATTGARRLIGMGGKTKRRNKRNQLKRYRKKTCKR